VTEPPAVVQVTEEASAEFSGLASDEDIESVAHALENNGVTAFVSDAGSGARELVGSMLAEGAEVFNNTSQTLEAIGVADDIERSGRYQSLRLRLYQMDREMQGREMRNLVASPDYVVGSAHAVTEGVGRCSSPPLAAASWARSSRGRVM
jgi:hypothetical protein